MPLPRHHGSGLALLPWVALLMVVAGPDGATAAYRHACLGRKEALTSPMPGLGYTTGYVDSAEALWVYMHLDPGTWGAVGLRPKGVVGSMQSLDIFAVEADTGRVVDFDVTRGVGPPQTSARTLTTLDTREVLADGRVRVAVYRVLDNGVDCRIRWGEELQFAAATGRGTVDTWIGHGANRYTYPFAFEWCPGDDGDPTAFPTLPPQLATSPPPTAVPSGSGVRWGASTAAPEAVTLPRATATPTGMPASTQPVSLNPRAWVTLPPEVPTVAPPQTRTTPAPDATAPPTVTAAPWVRVRAPPFTSRPQPPAATPIPPPSGSESTRQPTTRVPQTLPPGQACSEGTLYTCARTSCNRTECITLRLCMNHTAVCGAGTTACDTVAPTTLAAIGEAARADLRRGNAPAAASSPAPADGCLAASDVCADAGTCVMGVENLAPGERDVLQSCTVDPSRCPALASLGLKPAAAPSDLAPTPMCLDADKVQCTGTANATCTLAASYRVELSTAASLDVGIDGIDIAETCAYNAGVCGSDCSGVFLAPLAATRALEACAAQSTKCQALAAAGLSDNAAPSPLEAVGAAAADDDSSTIILTIVIPLGVCVCLLLVAVGMWNARAQRGRSKRMDVKEFKEERYATVLEPEKELEKEATTPEAPPYTLDAMNPPPAITTPIDFNQAAMAHSLREHGPSAGLGAYMGYSAIASAAGRGQRFEEGIGRALGHTRPPGRPSGRGRQVVWSALRPGSPASSGFTPAIRAEPESTLPDYTAAPEYSVA